MNLTLKPPHPSITPCRVCGRPCTEYGSVSGPENMPSLGLAVCEHCRSLTFEGEEPVLGYTNEKIEADYWLHYCHVGAGISSMLEPLHSIDKTGDLLDVGSGFGFIVDYWRRSGKGEACGMELAEYGRIGKSKLSIDVHHALLGDCEAVDSRTFDIVYSSEVIEHTDDPISFCKALAARCKPDGVAILTTPSNRAVIDSTSDSTKIAALSPYFHYFVASKTGLEHMLGQAGFSHIKVFDSGTRLFAWASNKPLPAIHPQTVDWDSYLLYLNSIADNPDEHVSSGALYRIFRDSWNLGRREEAYSAFDRLDKLAKDRFGIDLRNPDTKKWLAELKERDLRKYPAWIGVTLLVGSHLVAERDGDHGQALRMALASEEVLSKEINIWELKQFVQEAEAYHPQAAPWIFQLLVTLMDVWSRKLKLKQTRGPFTLKRSRTTLRLAVLHRMCRSIMKIARKIR